MALSAKERERIIEEEQLRFETRQALHREACAKHRPNRWLWWLAVAAIAYAAYCFLACGGSRCAWGHGGEGKTCHHGEMMDDDANGEPGQPLPPKK